MGDPAGIGAEVILKALANEEISQKCDATIIGNRDWLVKTYQHIKLNHNSVSIANPDNLSIIDIPHRENTEKIIVGEWNAATGADSFAYLESAITHTMAGKFDGIVTGPIAKSAWKEAGYDYPGQTELLAHKSGVDKFGMLFVARSPYTGWIMRALLATTHIPLSQVATTLTAQLLTRKLDLLVECLEKSFGMENGIIAIAGLNPHSGEQGQLGVEEKDWLIPWLEEERKNRPQWQLQGPIPPDTMWVKAGQAWYGNSSVDHVPDAYLALYHDQGLIPVKLMAFDRAVNTSIGLPFVRTSPDHGTAFDIAGKGIADATSMEAAIELAAQLVGQSIV